MSNEPNEDLIEATIRRVAEARAARERELAQADPDGVAEAQAREAEAWQPQASAEDAPSGLPAGVDEQSIEETIRRVQSRAFSGEAPPDDGNAIESEPEQHDEPVQEPAGWQPPEADPHADEDPLIAETIRRVQAQAAAQDPQEPQQSPDDPHVEEDPAIAETIRRVQAQAAAQAPQEPAPEQPPADEQPSWTEPQPSTPRHDEHESQWPAAEQPAATGGEQESAGPQGGADEQLIEETIRRVQAQATPSAPPQEEPSPWTRLAEQHTPSAPDGDYTQEPQAPQPQPPHADDMAQTVLQLQRELALVGEQVQSLARRIDALSHVAPTETPADRESDSAWEQSLRSAKVTPLQQRPPIFRDPSPQTATAEHLQPEAQEPDQAALDTRPIPQPLPPLHAQSKRGLELLPRTYRITVEDKRRGVDLVPLHRALLGIEHVRDMSLLSYNNGVAIVSLDMVDELDPQVLEDTVAHAMARSAKVEVHNENTMVVKLADA